jgi:carboxyl-terminal processing protease
MDNSGRNPIKIVLGVLLISALVCGAFATGFGGGYYAHSRVAKPPLVECPVCLSDGTTDDSISGPTAEESRTFAIFWEVWHRLQQDYYGDLPTLEEMADGAIRGLLGTLDDRFTSYIAPDIARVINEDASGTFEGIGAMVRMNEENILEISRPFPGQPADKAGVLAGDLVMAVDGKSILGLGLYEAIGLIRGPAGSQVVLTLQRADKSEPFDVTITRARIEIPIVESKMLEGDIAYISLFEFSAPATERMEVALKELLAQKPKGLILDLRDNPGGFLQQAIRVSDLFIASGVIVIERTRDGDEQVFRATADGIGQNIPLVVLVNGGSASASEIVAGALQDTGRAKLIGEKTFGKGSVQLPQTLSNGAELRVTIARWFTPNDRAIHGEGLQPDIEVALTAEDAKADRDPQLDRAIEYLQTGH